MWFNIYIFTLETQMANKSFDMFDFDDETESRWIHTQTLNAYVRTYVRRTYKQAKRTNLWSHKNYEKKTRRKKCLLSSRCVVLIFVDDYDDDENVDCGDNDSVECRLILYLIRQFIHKRVEYTWRDCPVRRDYFYNKHEIFRQTRTRTENTITHTHIQTPQ